MNLEIHNVHYADHVWRNIVHPSLMISKLEKFPAAALVDYPILQLFFDDPDLTEIVLCNRKGAVTTYTKIPKSDVNCK
jgi:hypothetical protein